MREGFDARKKKTETRQRRRRACGRDDDTELTAAATVGFPMTLGCARFLCVASALLPPRETLPPAGSARDVGCRRAHASPTATAVRVHAEPAPDATAAERPLPTRPRLSFHGHHTAERATTTTLLYTRAYGAIQIVRNNCNNNF